jgi:hypothetical protein
MEALRRWLVMAILCFSGGIIFMLPFLREVYYIPVMEAADKQFSAYPLRSAFVTHHDTEGGDTILKSRGKTGG